MRLSTVVFLVPAVLLVACTWVPMEPQGRGVRVLAAGPIPAGCQKRGEVSVSVKDKVGFYRRDPLKVKDELETLARNQAASMPANTVQPLDPPYNGSQRFAALDCPRR